MTRSSLTAMIHSRQSGFTLIELSIVMVIIGLIIGGILVGQDMIRTATIRAQIAQIEQFNTAANAFKSKYDCLPGDCTPAEAATYGFLTRSGAQGDGDGDGFIDAKLLGALAPNQPDNSIGGENTLFWEDLSMGGMIAGYFPDYTHLAGYLRDLYT
jgi:prepilin-type N-terminal cleavage/methylation domain-containing protein